MEVMEGWREIVCGIITDLLGSIRFILDSFGLFLLGSEFDLGLRLPLLAIAIAITAAAAAAA